MTTIRSVRQMMFAFLLVFCTALGLSNAVHGQTSPENSDNSAEKRHPGDRFAWFVGLFQFSRTDNETSGRPQNTASLIKPDGKHIVATRTLKNQDEQWQAKNPARAEGQRLFWTLDIDHQIVGQRTFDAPPMELSLAYPVQSFEYRQHSTFNYPDLSPQDDAFQLVDIAGDHYFAGTTVNFGATYINLSSAINLSTIEAVSPISYSASISEGDGFYTQTGFTWGNWQPWLGYGQWFTDDENQSSNYITAQLGLIYRINGDRAKVKIGIESLRLEETPLFESEEDTVSGVRGEIYFNF